MHIREFRAATFRQDQSCLPAHGQSVDELATTRFGRRTSDEAPSWVIPRRVADKGHRECYISRMQRPLSLQAIDLPWRISVLAE